MANFKVGDTVYYIWNNEIRFSIINEIEETTTLVPGGGSPMIKRKYFLEREHSDKNKYFKSMDLFNSFDDLVDFYREYLKNTNRYK